MKPFRSPSVRFLPAAPERLLLAGACLLTLLTALFLVLPNGSLSVECEALLRAADEKMEELNPACLPPAPENPPRPNWGDILRFDSFPAWGCSYATSITPPPLVPPPLPVYKHHTMRYLMKSPVADDEAVNLSWSEDPSVSKSDRSETVGNQETIHRFASPIRLLVQRRNEEGEWTPLKTLPPDVFSFSDEATEPETEYSYRILAETDHSGYQKEHHTVSGPPSEPVRTALPPRFELKVLTANGKSIYIEVTRVLPGGITASRKFLCSPGDRIGWNPERQDFLWSVRLPNRPGVDLLSFDCRQRLLELEATRVEATAMSCHLIPGIKGFEGCDRKEIRRKVATTAITLGNGHKGSETLFFPEPKISGNRCGIFHKPPEAAPER